MTDEIQTTNRAWLGPAVVFLAAVVLRLLVQAGYCYNLDSVGFVQAVGEFDLRRYQPHAPGYFLYVMAARLLNVAVGDPHTSLVWLSVLASAGVAALLGRLGTEMFGPRAGWAAGLLALTTPSLWFHGAVALVYVVDAFLVCLLVGRCWAAIKRGGTTADVVAIGLLLAIIAGVRSQTAPQLVPLVAFCFWKLRPPRVRKAVLGVAVALAAGLAWFLPMLRLGGGWSAYAELFQRSAVFNAHYTLLGGGLDSLVWNVFFVGAHTWAGLAVVAIVLLAAVVYRVAAWDPARRAAWHRDHGLALAVLAWWAVPMVVFGTLIAFTVLPGYVLSYLPVGVLLAGAALGGLRRFALVVALAVAANAAVFLAWPAAADGLFLRVGLTARGIRDHDTLLATTIRVLRASCPPAETVVLHAYGNTYLSLRHLQLYTPEYEQYLLQPDPAMSLPADRPLLAVQARLGSVAAPVVAGKRWVVLVVPPGRTLHDYDGRFDSTGAVPIDGAAGVLYRKRID